MATSGPEAANNLQKQADESLNFLREKEPVGFDELIQTVDELKGLRLSGDQGAETATHAYFAASSSREAYQEELEKVFDGELGEDKLKLDLKNLGAWPKRRR